MTTRNFPATERELLEFFQANPGEELSSDDAIAKFGKTRRVTVNALAALSGAGVLERVSVYRLRKPEGGVRVPE